jgi:hypothetical protein
MPPPSQCVSAADIVNLAIASAALAIAASALAVSRRQLTIDARALDLAERQLQIDERQHEAFERKQAARAALSVDLAFADGDANDVVHNEHDVWTAITVVVLNEGDADAPDVHVEILVPAGTSRRIEWNATLRGYALPVAEAVAPEADALTNPSTGDPMPTRVLTREIDQVYAGARGEFYARMLIKRGETLPMLVRAWTATAPDDVAEHRRTLRHGVDAPT